MTKPNLLLAVLLCSTVLASGCDAPEHVDPIWSEWEAAATGCSARTRIEIDDDYRGDGRVVFDDCSVCQVNLEVEPLGEGEYELDIDGVDCQGTLDLECVLDDDELECEDPTGAHYDLERG